MSKPNAPSPNPAAPSGNPAEPCDLSAVTARRLIGAKKLSPVELLASCLRRIEATNGAVNAVVAMDERAARKAAKQAENQVMRGDDLGLLHGLPVAVKDLQATAGLRTTWGSLIYKDHVPKEDEASVASVRTAGGVILAKTNSPEFGAGANTRNRVYGATGNPFKPVLTCGGSSGGSAVALALGQVPLATGSDYGGSLRTPAAYCGVVGFRPSPGVVPGADRAIALSPFPVTGPMARTVADAHLLLKAQIAVDKRDPFSSDDVMRIPEHLMPVDLGNIRLGISTDLGCAPIDEAIAQVFQNKVKLFRGCFAEAQYIDPDFTADVHDVFETLRGLYFVAAHAERLEKHRDLLDANVIDNTTRGLALTSLQIARAGVHQSRIAKNFLDYFNEVDILICPAASVSPFPHAHLSVTEINGAAMPTYMRWLAVVYALTTALPAVCVIPCGVDHLGMPFGIQICGPIGSDALVLEVAHALELVLADDPSTARPVPDWRALVQPPAAKD
jgi:amidase